MAAPPPPPQSSAELFAETLDRATAALASSPSCSPLSSSACEAPSNRLNGKVVLVTGAAGGFGRSYAVRAAAFGAKIVASDLAPAALETLVEEIRAGGGTATSAVCDVTSWEQQVAMFRHAVETYGVVDVVVVNAGIPEQTGWLEHSVGKDGEPEKPSFATLDVNVIGAAYTVNLAFYHLRKNPGEGHKAILLLGSMSSFFPIPLGPLYTMSKHAVLGLFRSTYFNGLSDGISVNIVCPWFVLTPILAPATRLLIAGLPLATVPRVVDAMLYGTSTEQSGVSLCVDASGVLAVPFRTFCLGDDTYYTVFETRARGLISTIRTIKDVIKVLKSQTSLAGLLWLLGALLAGIAAFFATRLALRASKGI